MAISLTPDAIAVVRRSLELARHDPSEVGVRLREVSGGVQPRFAPGPEPTDVVIETEGLRIFVDARLAARHPDAEIGVSAEHERLIVTPV